MTTPLEALRTQTMRAPHALALVESAGPSWTRQALLDLADGAMRGLRAHDFARGDRVLFSVRPGATAVALVLAVHELGGVLVAQDPGVGDALFAARVRAIAPRWVFAEGLLLARPGSIADRLLRWAGMRLAPLGGLEGVRFVRVGAALPGAASAIPVRRLTAARSATAHAPITPIADDAEAMIVHTSGTTAEPRAVVHTRRSLRAILGAVGRELGLGPGDVLFARDLHLVLPALAAGAVVVVPSRTGFDAAQTYRVLRRQKVTHAFLVTRDCRLLMEWCEARRCRLPATVRVLTIGAAPVPAPFLARLRAALPDSCDAWCVYGATEVLPIARVALEAKVAWRGVGDLVGAPVPGVTVRLDDAGELHVSGERLCRGYLGGPVMDEYATGDLARLDDGRIVLLGRVKDMIIRGEFNIYPGLYEPLIEQVPGVRRAAMIGDYDPAAADERVILVVEPEAGELPAALEARVAHAIRVGPRRIDRAALPDRIVVRTLPESGRSHKVDKAALRALLGAREPGR